MHIYIYFTNSYFCSQNESLSCWLVLCEWHISIAAIVISSFILWFNLAAVLLFEAFLWDSNKPRNYFGASMS